jgi:hypothetical protein
MSIVPQKPKLFLRFNPMRKMVAIAFGEDQSGGSATRLTVEDLKLGVLGHSPNSFTLLLVAIYF